MAAALRLQLEELQQLSRSSSSPGHQLRESVALCSLFHWKETSSGEACNGGSFLPAVAARHGSSQYGTSCNDSQLLNVVRPSL